MIQPWTLAVVLTLVFSDVWAGQNSAASLNGRWTVTGVAGAQDTASLSSDEADQLKGAEIVVTAASVQFAGETCEKPVFTQARHGTQRFFRREYKLDPRSLRLPDPVTEIEITCREPSPISFAYLRDQRHMVFFWRGFFLDAKKKAPH